jgi:hypothetical protein
MAAASTEQAVLALFVSGNKPFSVQNLVDLLAHAGKRSWMWWGASQQQGARTRGSGQECQRLSSPTGHKKAGITKALDSLTSSGQLVAKVSPQCCCKLLQALSRSKNG